MEKKVANYPTPHIKAKPGDFAKTVLMPGDPHRSRFIAENFLEGAELVNDVRGVQGYTGKYRGVPVSVMASGMGMPSVGIYSYELFNFFDVDSIIRVGSAGAMSEKIRVRDVVVGMGASTDSNYASQFRLPGTFSAICSFGLLRACVQEAEAMGVRCHVGNILSTDTFYSDTLGLREEEQPVNVWGKMGVLAVEMEAAALYLNAARCGKRALAICTVSDHLITGESTTSDERQNSFTEMMELALRTALAAEEST